MIKVEFWLACVNNDLPLIYAPTFTAQMNRVYLLFNILWMVHTYLSAYLSVLRVCSVDVAPGAMLAIIHVLEWLPTNESLRTWVSLLCLNGVWRWSWSRARMHSFSWKCNYQQWLFISLSSRLVVVFYRQCHKNSRSQDPVRCPVILIVVAPHGTQTKQTK